MISERIDAITRISADYLGTVLPAPKSCKIEITADCNYKCSFCVKSLRDDRGTMDRKLYSRLIRELREAGVEELGVFYIGESFTCKWLPEAIAEASARRPNACLHFRIFEKMKMQRYTVGWRQT